VLPGVVQGAAASLHVDRPAREAPGRVMQVATHASASMRVANLCSPSYKLSKDGAAPAQIPRHPMHDLDAFAQFSSACERSDTSARRGW
jgi:hypothetical protein